MLENGRAGTGTNSRLQCHYHLLLCSVCSPGCGQAPHRHVTQHTPMCLLWARTPRPLHPAQVLRLRPVVCTWPPSPTMQGPPCPQCPPPCPPRGLRVDPAGPPWSGPLTGASACGEETTAQSREGPSAEQREKRGGSPIQVLQTWAFPGQSEKQAHYPGAQTSPKGSPSRTLSPRGRSKPAALSVCTVLLLVFGAYQAQPPSPPADGAGTLHLVIKHEVFPPCNTTQPHPPLRTHEILIRDHDFRTQSHPHTCISIFDFQMYSQWQQQ